MNEEADGGRGHEIAQHLRHEEEMVVVDEDYVALFPLLGNLASEEHVELAIRLECFVLILEGLVRGERVVEGGPEDALRRRKETSG